jgi:hypothetical protein
LSARPEIREVTTSYPHIDRTSHRSLGASYAGDVLIWDIDKTYLDTRFSSLRGLLSIPFELAIDKQALPGTVPLLRALRRGPGERSAIVPLFFVSGSPPQLRSIIERKMTLDGVGFDGITFKDQWGLLKRRRPRAIKHQVGYKLLALLLYRLDASAGARWLLFGDDVEQDAEVFRLFGEVCGGLYGDQLDDRLRTMGTDEPERRACLEVAERLEPGDDPVLRIFIHLASGRSPNQRNDNVVETRSFLQTALVCAQLERLNPRDLPAVAEDLRRQRVPERHIVRDLHDARDRLGVPEALCALAGVE